MTITTDTRKGRCQILHTPNMAPTIKLPAYDLDYNFDIREVDIAGLAQLGVLTFEPSITHGGRPSPRVDFLDATRAWMLLNYGRAHHCWDAGMIEQIKDHSSDTTNLINRLGCFAVAVAFSRPKWEFTLNPLPGFVAADHEIYLGTAVHNMREYTAGKGRS